MKATSGQAQQAVIRADATNPIKNSTRIRTGCLPGTLTIEETPKKKQQEAHAHSTLLSVDMLPKIAHACSLWGLEKGLDFG